jgi:hypothetical protein
MIYLRTADADLYETVRLQLDAAWGHPTEDGRTITCIEPAATAPRDAEGRIVLAVREVFVSYEPAASMLPVLLESGAVEYISEDDYSAVGNLYG